MHTPILRLDISTGPYTENTPQYILTSQSAVNNSKSHCSSMKDSRKYTVMEKTLSIWPGPVWYFRAGVEPHSASDIEGASEDELECEIGI